LEIKNTKLNPNSTSQVKGRLRIETGMNQYQVHLQSGSMVIPYRLETYGYTFRSEDIGEIKSLKLSRVFTYYRTGDEALINIRDTESNEVVKRIPLSRRDNTIDLSELKKSEYELEIVSYSSDRKDIVLVQLEE